MIQAKGIPTAVAAAVMGKSEDFIRWGLRQRRLPIGDAVQMSEHRWSYYISSKLLSDYTGITVLTLDRMAEQYRQKVRRRKHDSVQ